MQLAGHLAAHVYVCPASARVSVHILGGPPYWHAVVAACGCMACASDLPHCRASSSTLQAPACTSARPAWHQPTRMHGCGASHLGPGLFASPCGAHKAYYPIDSHLCTCTCARLRGRKSARARFCSAVRPSRHRAAQSGRSSTRQMHRRRARDHPVGRPQRN